jgi:hypothetical protein
MSNDYSGDEGIPIVAHGYPTLMSLGSWACVFIG